MNDWAIILYGSHARGTADADSDVDILVLGESPQEQLRATTAPFEGILSHSGYDWQEFDAMRADGSIFLRHIRMEGRVLAARGRGGHALDELRDLPPYRHVDRDLTSFDQTLDDVRDSLQEGGSPRYELTVLLSLIRHCAILGTYLAGRLGFSIGGPLATIRGICPLDDTRVGSFDSAYRQVTRGKPCDSEAPLSDVWAWHEFAGQVLTCVRGLR
jgi:hypothetical protein